MNTLTIIGAGGHGKVVADIALKLGTWDNIQFLDDDVTSFIYPIVGKIADYTKFIDNSDFIVAIGNNKSREAIQTRLEANDCKIISLLHPSAIVGENVLIDLGTVIMAGVVVNPSTKIGKGCIINTSSSLDHDNVIEDYVHISPGVTTAGSVRIGNGTWLGISSIVSNNVNICSGCKVGAGAMVVKDINKEGTYVGVPAKILV